MVEGIGCDIVSISRIKRLINRWSDKFLNRVFTHNEQLQAIQRCANYYGYLAKRFAAKEALSKAMKTGIGKQLSFLDCEVMNSSTGAPHFIFHLVNNSRDNTKLEINNVLFNVHLSLSDEKEYAQAFVIISRSHPSIIL